MSDAIGSPLLQVEDLHVDFTNGRADTHAVRGVSFDVAVGETLGIVGESGSGKSVTARSIMRLLPMPPARISAEHITFDGVDLLDLSADAMRAYRGSKIAMVYQDALRALNPIMRVGDQVREAVRIHDGHLSRRAARQRTLELLNAVQIPDADRRYNSYPHQLSGGMRQRVVIAMALAGRPQLLIADEPTTALDVTVQATVLDLLTDLQAEFGMSMILVTHDLGVAAWHTHRIMVMYAGQMVEQARATDLFENVRMPYTRGLLDSIPRLDEESSRPLQAIPGRPLDAKEQLVGCSFHPRCSRADDRCRSTQPQYDHDGDHVWACWNPLPRNTSHLDATRAQR